MLAGPLSAQAHTADRWTTSNPFYSVLDVLLPFACAREVRTYVSLASLGPALLAAPKPFKCLRRLNVGFSHIVDLGSTALPQPGM